MNDNVHIVFVLNGLNDSLTNRQIYFALTLTSYLFTVFVNLTLILTVCLDQTLHQPMYVFMCNLSFTGICGASSFYLKLLSDLLADAHVITYTGCLAQMFISYTYIFCQLSSLTVMAYDRYLAICQPLRYWALMTSQKVALLLLLTWCLSSVETAVGLALMARLRLCSHHIPRIFCTNWEVVKLSCSDTSANNLYGITLMFLHSMQVIVILVSYVQLVRSAARSQEDQKKFAQTCLPHLVSLLVFFASLLFDTLYSRYGGSSMPALQNALAAEFLVVPPIVNPIIYGMNLKQIRSRIGLRINFRPQS
ncbi:PREDICTED: olfactory receptor-like protein OLF4 [Poecilia mexicana]|uniref:olfactory receptor-like protein OLF4 n=1 Tax=Poecilia mexicana TaxID=48701 RepID=UPI0004444E3C|nr:PREDICTED: olfactory receptor-like protein OLF4 [Poecilia mexicana]XP_016517075.1 PREDICTED: olfactory receptor-like protein OLF4 [Poecilia formosa]